MKKLIFLLCILGCCIIAKGQEKGTSEAVSVPDSVATSRKSVSNEKDTIVSRQNLTDIIYLQNQTITGTNTFEATTILVGSDVNSQLPQGNVTIASGKTTLKANTTVITGTTTIALGAELEITPF